MAQKFAKEPDPTLTRLIDEGHKIQEEYSDLLERREAVRDSSRALVAAGIATKEQAATVEEMFPKRTRKPKDGEDNGTTTAAQAATEE